MVEIAYIDESYDQEVFAMSALIVPIHRWRETFDSVKAHRQKLKNVHGVFTSKELHAVEFVSGRGSVADQMVPKGLRARIFLDTMDMLAKLPVAIIGGAWPIANMGQRDIHAKAFSRIAERLERRAEMLDGYIIRMVDEGNDEDLNRLAQRSAVYNMVGSAYGAWEDGSPAKNIPNSRLVEDPIFRASERSYFLQLADFVAYALLKSETAPTPLVQRYRLDLAYERLEPVLVKAASRKDPRELGIIRT